MNFRSYSKIVCVRIRSCIYFSVQRLNQGTGTLYFFNERKSERKCTRSVANLHTSKLKRIFGHKCRSHSRKWMLNRHTNSPCHPPSWRQNSAYAWANIWYLRDINLALMHLQWMICPEHNDLWPGKIDVLRNFLSTGWPFWSIAFSKYWASASGSIERLK